MIVDEDEATIKSPPPRPANSHLHLPHSHHSTTEIKELTPPAHHNHSSLTEQERNQLIDSAMKMRDSAYAPYSHFRVGAAILDINGKLHTGCNVENASYGLSICAERVAYTKAVSEGSKKFRAIVVSTDVADRFLSPCGACRQFAAEFGEHRIILVKPDRTFKEYAVRDLLPDSFVPNDLEAPKV